MAWIGGALSLGGSLLSGAMSDDAADSASDGQSQASAASIREQKRQFDLSRGDLAPYRATGNAALNKLSNYLGLGAGSGGSGGYGSGPTALTSQGDFGTTFNPALVKDPTYLKAWYEIFGGPGQGDSTKWSEADLEAAMRQRLPKDYLAKISNETMAPPRDGDTWTNPANGAQYKVTNGQWTDLGGNPVPLGAGEGWSDDGGFARPTSHKSVDPDTGMLTRKFTVKDFWDDPVTKLGFQFGLDEGTKGISRMAGANGNLRSGQTLKALTQFGTDYAGTKANESLNRDTAYKTNIFNMLSGVAGTGQTAATTTGTLGANMATNVGNIMTADANARGAASISKANSFNNGLSNVGNWWQQNQFMNALNNRGSAGYTGMGRNGGFVNDGYTGY